MKHESRHCKVGGSVMIAVPPAVLKELKISAGTRVGVAAEEGRLVVEPVLRPRYTLAQLLSEASSGRRLPANRTWTSGKARGRELV